MGKKTYIILTVLIGVGVVFITYRTLWPLDKISITAEFGGVSLTIEYATSTVAQERGLGGRASIPNDYGMLFAFQKDGRYGIWMKGMLIPIDIFWLNNKGQVISITQDAATSSYPNVFYPAVPARYVLETAAGFAREHNIATGTPLVLKDSGLVSK